VQFDIGLQGLGILTALALGFGIIAQFVGRARTRWDWLVGAAAYFVGGLFVSEVWFGEATIEELQPIIDGLMFDEVLLISLIPGILAVVVWRFLTAGSSFHRPVSPQGRAG
jgi:hypothetical protein